MFSPSAMRSKTLSSSTFAVPRMYPLILGWVVSQAMARRVWLTFV
jgi:hypothetical protein